jgi:uncharacterized membrane protein YccC
MALRNAIGVAVPLAVGLLLQNPGGGVLGASGALNVCFSDGTDPYRRRARRMLAAALFVSLAVFAGRLVGRNHVVAITLEAAFAFAAGMLVAVGQTPADIGTITLVTLIVFVASPAPLGKALTSCLLAFGGGLVQTTISLAMWPIRRYGPESRALADLYADLARSTAAGAPATTSPPSSESIQTARTAMAALAGNRSVEAARYHALLGQAERIRLALLTLRRLHTRISRDPAGAADAAALDASLQLASHALASISACLENRGQTEPPPNVPDLSALPTPADDALAAMRRDACFQLDALAGQIRSALELASHASPKGLEEFSRAESEQPWTLRVTGSLAALRANLSPNSSAFRHAVRLAVCVAIADTFARSFGWNRSYWAPMTLAIVLKPDFAATYSRGLLRLAGTFTGLGVATALSVLHPSQAEEAAMIAGFVFLMRWGGPANYGLLVAPLTGLVVFLFSLGGTPPGEVILARAINTVAGGVIALTAYRLWPTWERKRLPEALAGLFDAYREYFQAVRDAYLRPGLEQDPDFMARLSDLRQASRLARSNLEASVARLTAEPGANPVQLTAIEVIEANSHRFIHAAMSLEAGLFRSRAVPARAAFRDLTNGIGATLYFLSAYLRGSSSEPGDLPDLRAAHNVLVHSGDPTVDRYALVNVETDRITNSLNSLTVEILQLTESTI